MDTTDTPVTTAEVTPVVTPQVTQAVTEGWLLKTRHELVNDIKKLTVNHYSNIKFYKLLWSRLLELGVKVEHATHIASVVDYDFKNIPEDDDSLSEVATEVAEYLNKVYKHVVANGIKDITPLLKYFKLPFHLHITKL